LSDPLQDLRKEVGNDYWAAEQRSQQLLRAWLLPYQRHDARGVFEVVGCDTGKRYRINRGTIFNIQELDEFGKPAWAWCLNREDLPAGDLNNFAHSRDSYWISCCARKGEHARTS
jgi:hypothetical protein